MAKMHYIGDGTLIPGIPPRDLTAEEAEQWAAVIAEVNAARPGRELYVAMASRREEAPPDAPDVVLPVEPVDGVPEPPNAPRRRRKTETEE